MDNIEIIVNKFINDIYKLRDTSYLRETQYHPISFVINDEYEITLSDNSDKVPWWKFWKEQDHILLIKLRDILENKDYILSKEMFGRIFDEMSFQNRNRFKYLIKKIIQYSLWNNYLIERGFERDSIPAWEKNKKDEKN